MNSCFCLQRCSKRYCGVHISLYIPWSNSNVGDFRAASIYIAIIQAGPNVVELYGIVGDKIRNQGPFSEKDRACWWLYVWYPLQMDGIAKIIHFIIRDKKVFQQHYCLVIQTIGQFCRYVTIKNTVHTFVLKIHIGYSFLLLHQMLCIPSHVTIYLLMRYYCQSSENSVNYSLATV